MAATLEIEPTQNELREQQLEKQFGRRVAPHSPYRTTQPILKGHTSEEEAKLVKIYEQEKNYILLDPITKKPAAEAKEFFYKIVAIVTAVLGANETETRINFQVQKYWRNKTYKVQISPDNANEKTVHEPYFERHPKGDRLGRDGGLKATGEAIYDADDFLARFVEDKSE